MEKRTVEMTLLLDFYGELLTEKQREYLELYYNEDFSLAEIAQNDGISRQGVRDAIRRGETALLETERKTGLLRRFGEVERVAGRVEARLHALQAEIDDETLSPLFGEIYADLEKLSQ